MRSNFAKSLKQDWLSDIASLLPPNACDNEYLIAVALPKLSERALIGLCDVLTLLARQAGTIK